MLEEGAQGSDGVDAGVLRAESGEDVGVELLEGVEDEGAGLGAVADLGLAESEAKVIRVGGADEARDVAGADQRHAGDPVDDRLVQVAVRQEALICSMPDNSRNQSRVLLRGEQNCAEAKVWGKWLPLSGT